MNYEVGLKIQCIRICCFSVAEISYVCIIPYTVSICSEEAAILELAQADKVWILCSSWVRI